MSAHKAMNMSSKVRTLQRKLYCAAKQSLERKFGALYDKIYRLDVLCEAWKRVRANGGGPGIDEETIPYIEEEIGVAVFLQDLHDQLRSKRYRPKAVKRSWIEKPGPGRPDGNQDSSRTAV
jgi:RNA-directed DNA polymerase